ncbi:hypothetical protein ABIE44_001826 [Marmoricola sp. OAE513]|uniref:hypothetical protein n=1 Tax=Marmoricola sp. OAE513 TaxID=2817894 RepID=UPI001AE7FAC5
MTRSNAPKKLGLRRLATFTAALGALVMSSGVALMVTASPANAAKTPVYVCHATSSDTNPYTYIVVDDDSVKSKGHLEHRSNPNKTWKTDGTFDGKSHVAGQAKPDIIGDFVDDKGVSHVYDGVVTKSRCDGAVVVTTEATADIEYTEPSCAAPTAADFEVIGNNLAPATYTGSKTPGGSITVTAHAAPGATFEGGGTTLVFPQHTFDPAVDPTAPPCVVVDVPGVATASVDYVEPSCANNNVPSVVTNGTNVEFVTVGDKIPGGKVTVTANAVGNNEFAVGDPKTKVFDEHTFGPAEANCVLVEVPETPVDTPVVDTPTDTPIATPTLVHAGLTAPDLRSEQGLALLLTGMVLMILAAGLGLARPIARARS